MLQTRGSAARIPCHQLDPAGRLQHRHGAAGGGVAESERLARCAADGGFALGDGDGDGDGEGAMIFQGGDEGEGEGDGDGEGATIFHGGAIGDADGDGDALII